MPQSFSCPHCAGTTLVADEFAGSRGPCVHCGREVVIPSFTPSPYVGRRWGTLGRRWGLSQHQLHVVGAVLGILATVAACAAIIVATIPIWQRARLQSQRHQSRLNLEKIGGAIRAYEADHGRLPPAYVFDVSGKPLYSWRVLILPYLGDEEKSLHQQFKLSEPWDSWHNRFAAARMPKVFASPLDSAAAAANESNYKVIVGPSTLFPPPPGERKLSDVTDELLTTIMVVECVSPGGSFWTEPVDLDATKMSFGIADGSAQQLGGCDPLGAHVLFADGSTGILPLGILPPIVRTMSTINLGEPTFPDSIIWSEDR